MRNAAVCFVVAKFRRSSTFHTFCASALESCCAFALARSLVPQAKRFQQVWPHCCPSSAQDLPASATQMTARRPSWRSVRLRTSAKKLLRQELRSYSQRPLRELRQTTCCISSTLAHANVICVVVRRVGRRMGLACALRQAGTTDRAPTSTFLHLHRRKKTNLLCRAKSLGHARLASLTFRLVLRGGRLLVVCVLPPTLTPAFAAPLRTSAALHMQTKRSGRHLALCAGRARAIDVASLCQNWRASARAECSLVFLSHGRRRRRRRRCCCCRCCSSLLVLVVAQRGVVANRFEHLLVPDCSGVF